MDLDRVLENTTTLHTLSKQVTMVFRVAAKCLEAMASSEQLRTRESWVPEVNSVIREHMRSLDMFVEDLIYVPDGYNTQIEPISDALELSLSLDILNNLGAQWIPQISQKVAWVVMSHEYL